MMTTLNLPHTGMPFYINIVVVDKEDALENVLEEKPIIGFIASKVISEESFSIKIADTLHEVVPAKLEEMGITAAMDKK